jgi:hypothetical protein
LNQGSQEEVQDKEEKEGKEVSHFKTRLKHARNLISSSIPSLFWPRKTPQTVDIDSQTIGRQLEKVYDPLASLQTRKMTAINEFSTSTTAVS